MSGANRESPKGSITAALAALDAREPERALGLLLSRWRKTRAPELAELIEALSRRLERTPLAGKTRLARRREWQAIAAEADPADVPRLLAALVGLGRPEATALLAEVRRWDDDPRVCSAMLALLAAPPDGYCGLKARPFWRDVLALAAAAGDVRAKPRLEELSRFHAAGGELQTTLPAFLAPRLATIAAGMGRTTPLEAEELAACDELARRLRPTARARDEERQLAELYAAVYADPADDEPRLVLADVLVGRGDPRGELIQLQLASRSPARQAELVRAYGRRWLGGIDKVIRKSGATFERGFAAALRVNHAAPRDWAVALDAPEWATAEAIELPTSCADPNQLLARPQLRALARVAGAHASVFLCPRELALVSLEVRTLPGMRTVARSRALPVLRHLSICGVPFPPSPATFRPLWQEGALGARLESFAAPAARGWGAWVSELPRVGAALQQLSIDGRATFTRGADGRWRARFHRVDPALSRALANSDLGALGEIDIDLEALPAREARLLRRLFDAYPAVAFNAGAPCRPSPAPP